MSAALPIDPRRFVAIVSPLIGSRDVEGIISSIRSHWTLPQVVSLVECNDPDARKVASLALSLIGTKRCIHVLAKQLHDPDPVANQMAEHAMWSIWFRSGTERANSFIARGAQCFAKKQLDEAIDWFTKAIAEDESFAEAWNQRAMVRYLKEELDTCLVDCQSAVKHEPLHFGAWAGLGHCHACLGRIDEAIECYERARAINPHLECVEDLINQLRQARGEIEGLGEFRDERAA